MPNDRIARKASAWLARLDTGEAADDVRSAFERWRTADPRHAAAYADLERTWKRLDRLQTLGVSPEPCADLDINSPKSILARFGQRALSRTRTLRWQSRLRIAAAAIVAAATLGGWLAYTKGAANERYATTVGGYQRVTLADGSVVELNTNTEIRVALQPRQRRITLIRGEANFQVAHDPRRPLIVMSGEAAMRAVGTKFDVRAHDQMVEVVVTEGKVAVGQKSDVARSREDIGIGVPVLTAGQSAIVAAGGMRVRDVSHLEAERELAWHSGMLAFDSEPLPAVAEEFNRYNRKRLVVTDPALASVRIGGYFRATNVDAFVVILERNFGVRAVVEGDRILLELPAEQK